MMKQINTRLILSLLFFPIFVFHADGKEAEECPQQSSFPSVDQLHKDAEPILDQCLFSPIVEDEHWDVFWAQHQIGADLLREELEKEEITEDKVATIIGIWDRPENRHGEFVSNLIAGPRASAIIPLDNPLPYTDVSHIGNYESIHKKCHQNQSCPIYINNSTYWGSGGLLSELTSHTVSRIASLMNSMGITMFTAAGNNARPISSGKREASKANKIIVVASLAPDGYPSDFTNYGDGITIAVPSDYSLRSYNFRGEKGDFGKTSGGLPSVTSTVGGFTLLSGYPLNTWQIKVLLRETAMPIPSLPPNHLLGTGMLNAYKVGRVALRIKEQCKNHSSPNARAKCLSDSLATRETYNFSEESVQLFEGSIQSFPECSPDRPPGSTTNSCRQSRPELAHAFNNLRRAAFLDPTNPKPWNALACVRDQYFKDESINEFYHSMANPLKSREDVVRKICHSSDEKDTRLARYLSQFFLNALLEDRQCSSEALEFIAKAITAPWITEPQGLFEKILAHDNINSKALNWLKNNAFRNNIRERIPDFASTLLRQIENHPQYEEHISFPEQNHVPAAENSPEKKSQEKK